MAELKSSRCYLLSATQFLAKDRRTDLLGQLIIGACVKAGVGLACSHLTIVHPNMLRASGWRQFLICSRQERCHPHRTIQWCQCQQELVVSFPLSQEQLAGAGGGVTENLMRRVADRRLLAAPSRISPLFQSSLDEPSEGGQRLPCHSGWVVVQCTVLCSRGPANWLQDKRTGAHKQLDESPRLFHRFSEVCVGSNRNLAS